MRLKEGGAAAALPACLLVLACVQLLLVASRSTSAEACSSCLMIGNDGTSRRGRPIFLYLLRRLQDARDRLLKS